MSTGRLGTRTGWRGPAAIERTRPNIQARVTRLTRAARSALNDPWILLAAALVLRLDFRRPVRDALIRERLLLYVILLSLLWLAGRTYGVFPAD